MDNFCGAINGTRDGIAYRGQSQLPGGHYPDEATQGQAAGCGSEGALGSVRPYCVKIESFGAQLLCMSRSSPVLGYRG